ncbi:MAG: acyl carrier protein, partial [Proteobacteria bacterium]|nr:acyl carrier protein [Pseudomonadota bacterium]
SIDVVQFIVQLETNFHRKDLPFEKLLMTDGRYREDFTVREVVGFLNQYL